jgi:hypothetical protein
MMDLRPNLLENLLEATTHRVDTWRHDDGSLTIGIVQSLSKACFRFVSILFWKRSAITQRLDA